MLTFKLRQNILNKIEKSSKTGQYKKSLISTFQYFLTVIGKICLEEILGTTSRVFEIAKRGGGGSQILMGNSNLFQCQKQLSVNTEHQLKSKLTWPKCPKSMKLKQKWNRSNNLKIYLMQVGLAFCGRGFF